MKQKRSPHSSSTPILPHGKIFDKAAGPALRNAHYFRPSVSRYKNQFRIKFSVGHKRRPPCLKRSDGATAIEIRGD
jgi:hypothetical protein